MGDAVVMPLGLVTDLVSRIVDAVCGARCAGCGARGVPTPCPCCTAALNALPRRIGAAFPDVGVARRLVRSAKFGHWRRGGRVLATHAVARLPRGPHGLVTWIPADRSRRARRGGHLPEQLARSWARQLGIPCQGVLRRRRGPTQQGLDRIQRRRNVAGVWRLAPGIDPRTLDGVSILLVDDVRTSGATLDLAGSVLEACGAIVDRFAIVEHGTPTGPRARGVSTLSEIAAEIPARCAEFPLTTVSFPADSVLHDRRKDVPGVREPRPP